MTPEQIKEFNAATIEFMGWTVKEIEGTKWCVDQDGNKVMRAAFWAPDKSPVHRIDVENHILSLGEYSIDWFLGLESPKKRSIDITIHKTDGTGKWEGYSASRKGAFMRAFMPFYKSLTG